MAASGHFGFFAIALLMGFLALTKAAPTPTPSVGQQQQQQVKKVLYENLWIRLVIVSKTVHNTMTEFAQDRFGDPNYDPYVKQFPVFTPLKVTLQEQVFLDQQLKQMAIFEDAIKKIYAHEKQTSPQGRFTGKFSDILREIQLVIAGINYTQLKLGFPVTQSPTSPQTPVKPAQTSQDEWELGILKVLLNCLNPMLLKSHSLMH